MAAHRAAGPRDVRRSGPGKAHLLELKPAMRLSQITPLLITWNEEPNIGRCLQRLSWASKIVVIDSGSTDETLSICRDTSNVRVIHRAFDSFAEQCNFGLQQIESDWVLSMDADYMLPSEFADEVSRLADDVNGYSAEF